MISGRISMSATSTATLRKQFVTEPLWGVGSTPPYGHDGRSINLRDVILRHGGEAKASRDAFAALSEGGKLAIMEFLNSLVLFPPDDTASNLDPGDPERRGIPAARSRQHQAGRDLQRSERSPNSGGCLARSRRPVAAPRQSAGRELKSMRAAAESTRAGSAAASVGCHRRHGRRRALAGTGRGSTPRRH